MTTKLAGVAIQQAGTLYQVPTADSFGTQTLAANAAEGLLRLLGNDVYFKFQDKAFALAPNAHSMDEVPLEAVVEALRFACGSSSEQVKELRELPEDPNAPVYR